MINEASSSKTPPQKPPPLPVEASTQLAPGFRFHPTDEELVSYYLKRKVTGKPIRVDAISEIDLYRTEPWDLPHRSRLRSRDLEWYFFTPLDRKYSNRCRTNRATIEGYWKTTGKDRPIQRRSRTIGVKKTLVYHAGRAPRGQRTNWVMHEYRLEDEDLTRSGILQDGYAVCRIFQKSGPGPQNGAQYGAPFIEEEWEMEEEEDDKLVPVNVNREDAQADPAGHDFVQLGDFFQNPGSGIQDLDAFISESRPVEHELGSQTEDSSILVDEIFKALDSLDDLTQDADFSAPQVSKTTLNSLGEREGPEDQSNFAAIQSNGYVQLEDIFVEGNTNSSSDIHSNHCLLEIGNDFSVVDDTCPSKILFQKPVEGDLGDTNCSTSELDQLQICPAVQHDMFPQPFDPLDAVFWDHPSGQLAEDNPIYYDALNHEDLYSEDGFTFETSLSPLAEFDFSEDLMAYYDAADDNLIYTSPNLFLSQFKQANSFEWVEPNDSPEVVGSNSSSDKEVFHENLVQRSSLGKLQTGDGLSSGLNYNLTDDKPKHCQDKTLTNRLASILNSISAPPAFADEAALFGKTGRQIPAASGSALHLTASMIQIGNWTAMEESWTLQKHTELGFHLSYGLDGSMASKSVGREPRKTPLSGLFPTFCWRGFHLCFLSAAILALSYKIGHSFCKM